MNALGQTCAARAGAGPDPETNAEPVICGGGVTLGGYKCSPVSRLTGVVYGDGKGDLLLFFQQESDQL